MTTIETQIVHTAEVQGKGKIKFTVSAAGVSASVYANECFIFYCKDALPFIEHLYKCYQEIMTRYPFKIETLMHVTDSEDENDMQLGGCVTHLADGTGWICALSFHSNEHNLHMNMNTEETAPLLRAIINSYEFLNHCAD